MTSKFLFALLLIGAAAPLEFHWYRQWQDLQEAVRVASAQREAVPETEQNPVHF